MWSNSQGWVPFHDHRLLVALYSIETPRSLSPCSASQCKTKSLLQDCRHLSIITRFPRRSSASALISHLRRDPRESWLTTVLPRPQETNKGVYARARDSCFVTYSHRWKWMVRNVSKHRSSGMHASTPLLTSPSLSRRRRMCSFRCQGFRRGPAGDSPPGVGTPSA